MFIGGLTGRPVRGQLGYVLAVERKDYHTGMPIANGMMLQAPFRARAGGEFPVNQGASDGGEGSVPSTVGDDLFGFLGGSRG